MKKVLILCAAALMAACSADKSMFSDEARQENLKKNYTEGFKSAFPNVSLNQNWDYSNKNASYSLAQIASANSPVTRSSRAINYNVEKSDVYEVDQTTLQWMKEKLTDYTNHRELGNPFYIKVPNNGFTVVPIYQGQASNIFELHAVVDGVDITVWKKSEDVWVKTKEDGDWIGVHEVSNTELYRCTEKAVAIKASGYTFNNLPEYANMYFYLVVTDVTNEKYRKSIGVQMSSLDGQMLALQDCPRPSNIAEDNEVMIIGCEDAKNGDWDFNDVVLLVYGKPDVPKPVIIEEGTPVASTTTVRYMIEDLGATDDFDFNDVVVDVADITVKTPIYKNGILDSWKENTYEHRQQATIRHLGGTLPFTLTIGNTTLEEMQGRLDVDLNETFDISGWDMNTHNISIQVRDNSNKEVYNKVVFPKAGEAPMIIAVEPTQTWMPERQSVPESWFTVE